MNKSLEWVNPIHFYEIESSFAEIWERKVWEEYSIGQNLEYSCK